MTTTEPHPWPYPDIRRPPLLAGVDLISVPEAVGILGAKLYPDDWKGHEPPWRWREKWAPLRLGQQLTRTEYDPWVIRDSEGKEIRRAKGGPEPPQLSPGQGASGGRREVPLPEETARARRLLFEPDDPHDPDVADKPPRAPLFWVLVVLFCTGRVRSVASWEAAGDEGAPGLVRRHAEPTADWWGFMTRRGDYLRVTSEFNELCWTSLLNAGRPDGPSRHFRIYLPAADVEAIGPKEAAEVVKAAKVGRPKADWKAIFNADIDLLEKAEDRPLRNPDGTPIENRAIVAMLVEPPIPLHGRYEGPIADDRGLERVNIFDAESGARLGAPTLKESIKKELARYHQK